MQKQPSPSPFLRLWERPDSLVNGLLPRLAGSEKLGQAPPLERGLSTRRRMLSGGPKWLIVRGSPGRGLQIAIFWVSACSVVRMAFLESLAEVFRVKAASPCLTSGVLESLQNVGAGWGPPWSWPNSPEGERGLLKTPQGSRIPSPSGRPFSGSVQGVRESALPSRTVWSQTPLPGVADPLPGVAGTGQGSGPPSR